MYCIKCSLIKSQKYSKYFFSKFNFLALWRGAFLINLMSLFTYPAKCFNVPMYANCHATSILVRLRNRLTFLDF
jgi:hypothetical protein